ncbi:hypothetical protein [Mesorhizobium amorphae]|uniref:hypothetical protein n=1 Tax=Mesorhizobium amorphae TaxID=71433 RepID=UPI001181F57B|nr:hypothetical protein [Mesorhizobium amorphae]
MQAVIRCDAGSVIGGGHLVRCGALAAALRQSGYEVAFAVSNETMTTFPQLFADFPDALEGMTATESDVEGMASRWPSGVELAVVDHYGLGERFERRVAGWARKVLVIDDAPCDATFVPIWSTRLFDAGPKNMALTSRMARSCFAAATTQCSARRSGRSGTMPLNECRARCVAF